MSKKHQAYKNANRRETNRKRRQERHAMRELKLAARQRRLGFRESVVRAPCDPLCHDFRRSPRLDKDPSKSLSPFAVRCCKCGQVNWWIHPEGRYVPPSRLPSEPAEVEA